MKKPLILIADDDNAIRLVLEKKFNRSGFSTKSTAKGKTLLSWIENGEGDLVITDVIMEDSNGLELLPLIQNVRPDLPIIVMSGLNTIKTAIDASASGAYEYFPKPFDLDKVLDVVTKAFNSEKSGIKKTEAENYSYIYLDNSMSMNTNGENGNLLEIAAQKIIENAPEKDKYSLLTNDEIRSNISKKELETTDLLLKRMEEYDVKWLFLAGFLLKIPSKMIEQYPNKIINIHPALLPKYGGKGMYGENIYKAVLKNKETESGISVHFVNQNYDEGKIIFQKSFSLSPDENLESLTAKIHELEQSLFPKIIEKTLFSL